MRRDQAPKSNVDLTRKAMSVENINKLKPVLMKNINLNQKVRNYPFKDKGGVLSLENPITIKCHTNIFLEPSRSIKKWYSWYCHWRETFKRRSWYWKWFSYLKSTSSTKKFLPWNGLLITSLRILRVKISPLEKGKSPLNWLWTSSKMFNTSSKLHWRSTECMFMFISAVFNQCL